MKQSERVEALREEVGDRLDEWFHAHPNADAYEIVPVVLAGLVSELGVTREMVRALRHGGWSATLKPDMDRAADALTTLLDAAEVEL